MPTLLLIAVPTAATAGSKVGLAVGTLVIGAAVVGSAVVGVPVGVKVVGTTVGAVVGACDTGQSASAVHSIPLLVQQP